MTFTICLLSCAIPRAAKQASLTLLYKSPFSLQHNYCITRTFASVSVSIAANTELRSPDLVALEYAGLNLTDKISQELGHVRIRQHVNPLSSSFSVPAPVPDWSEVFRDPTLPLMVDIGSGSGRFLIWLAKQNPDSQNYLGLEIRAKLVKRAELWVKELALSNIHFIFANATISFKQLVSTYPGPLMLVSILCPDPHFKKRHHKRRVVQKPFVDSILTSLMPGGKYAMIDILFYDSQCIIRQLNYLRNSYYIITHLRSKPQKVTFSTRSPFGSLVFIQSDVLEVAVDMRKQFDSESGAVQHVDTVDPSVLCDDEGWLLNNPMGIRTEREIHAELEGAKIYRRLYQKRGYL